MRLYTYCSARGLLYNSYRTTLCVWLCSPRVCPTSACPPIQEDSDNDYESPDENYVCPLSEELGAGGSDEDYEPPPSGYTEDIPPAFSLAKPLGNDDYIGMEPHGGPDTVLLNEP